MRWSVLSDARGPVLRYAPEDREGRPIADLAAVVPDRTALDAVPAVMSGLRGWLLASEDLSLTAALIKAGARPRRHASILQWSAATPAPQAPLDPSWQAIDLPDGPDDPRWAAILPSWRAAYPPDHPDHFAGSDTDAITFLRRLLDGSELGPLHRATTLLLREGVVLAGIMVNVRPQDPPWGGPWVADIWRDPSLAGTGVGFALLARAQRMVQDDGFGTLGLAVSAGNPARRSYERAGFRTIVESQTVLIPD